jgi:folate-binding protein YgfZ
MPANLPGPREYHEERQRLGVPEGPEFGSERIFALDAGLEELNGVSFTKGCYIGQELTSRMKHRATARKRILGVAADAALPPPGETLRRGNTEIGELLSCHGTHGFALVRLDRLEEGAGETKVGEISVALTRPSWLAAGHGADDGT